MQLHVTLGRTVQTSLIHFTVYYSTSHCQDEACNRSDETQCVMSRFTLVLKVHALMKVMMGAQGTRSIKSQKLEWIFRSVTTLILETRVQRPC